MGGGCNGVGSGSPENYTTIPRFVTPSPQSYVLDGKVMLFAVVILFTVVVLFFFLHIYARCLLRRQRRLAARQRLFRVAGRHPSNPTSSDAAALGLDASVLASLPVFVFSSETHGATLLECAVCLSEFEEKEKGRLLPKCNHSFHIDCIDKWFQSHSTCPLCRVAVLPESPEQPLAASANRVDGNPEAGSGSGVCDSCPVDGETGPSSSSSGSSALKMGTSSSFNTKRLEIEVGTRRAESLGVLDGAEITVASPGAQGLKSPGSRILSLKRIFSGEKRAGALSTGSSSSVAEIDLEKGEEQQPHAHN